MKAVIETTLAISKTDVNTVEAQGLHQYTEQQIEDFCNDIGSTSPEAYSEAGREQVFYKALQIIRQLQGATKRHG